MDDTADTTLGGGGGGGEIPTKVYGDGLGAVQQKKLIKKRKT